MKTPIKNSYKISAVLFAHTAWVLFIYLSWPFIFFSNHFNYLYFVVMVLTLLSSTVLGGCWLTDWENRLRGKYSPSTVYNDKCIPYYAEKWIGIRASKHAIRTVFSLLLVASLAVVIKQFI